MRSSTDVESDEALVRDGNRTGPPGVAPDAVEGDITLSPPPRAAHNDENEDDNDNDEELSYDPGITPDLSSSGD